MIKALVLTYIESSGPAASAA